MNRTEQAGRAKRFLQLHHQPEVLVLPNVWDALGARLLVELGYPAIATASASVAFSLGYDDGEHISFEGDARGGAAHQRCGRCADQR